MIKGVRMEKSRRPTRMAGFRNVTVPTASWTAVGQLLLMQRTGKGVKVVADDEDTVYLPPCAWQVRPLAPRP